MNKIDSDTKQKIQSFVLLITHGYKVLMASLLTIFVPQKCSVITNDNSSNISSNNSSYYLTNNECTLKDNFINLIPLNQGALAINFITLALFLGFYIFEYYREYWCIEYLDIDPNKSINNLKKEIENYPNYKNKLIKLNKQYYIYSFILVVSNIINFIISSVLIYYYYYLDYKSITVLITYFLLIADKLFSTLLSSRDSFINLLPKSAYMKDSIIFNTIDSDYKKKEAINELEIVIMNI
jgi:hypothetical protein